MMTINTSYLSLRNKEQQTSPASKETLNEKRPGRVNLTSLATGGRGSTIAGGQMRSRLRAYMEEINNLQQQLSRLQDREISLKKMQKELIKTQENRKIFPDMEEPEAGSAASTEEISQKLLQLQETQEKIKSHITGNLVARENITASLVVIREKELAESIMKSVKDYVLTQNEPSMPNKIQLQQESILGLLG